MVTNIKDIIIQKIASFQKLDKDSIIVLNEVKSNNIATLGDKRKPLCLINLKKINDIRRINKFHESINSKLNNQDIYVSCAELLEERRKRFRNQIPFGFKNLIRIIDFLYRRVFPKLPILKQVYFFITKGHNRVISKAEVLGRVISCGFNVLEYFEHENLLYIISEKIKKPDFNMKVSYGPLFKMNRVGYQGKIIGVYKLRTMYPYSEYCQELIMRENKLAKSGKILNDFRITTWGKFFRKIWLDELPMFINFFKREVGLVGVRPLSITYFKKYPKDLQDLRIKTKPGLLPPYYADLPQSFDEILLSENKYLEKKLKSPFLTDIKYFYLAVINIVFKGARSK